MERKSRKRQDILECLMSTTEHPSAEWIYEKLKKKYPKMSLATVYRNLNQLKQAGLVRTMGIIDGQERYDADTTPHTHAICRICGKITDVRTVDIPDELANSVALNTGYKINRAELHIIGICPECLEKLNKS